MKTGNVYIIIYNLNNKIFYIGSTFQPINYRLKNHQNLRSKTSISEYMKKYGSSNFMIKLLKKYNVCDKYHLRAYEQLWLNKFKNSCNQQHSFNPLQKYIKNIYNKYIRTNFKDLIREYNNRYINKNREKYLQNRKKLYENNKEKILENNKIYLNKNREKILSRRRELYKLGRNIKNKNYYEKNKEKILEKITCECGCEVVKSSLLKHKKTKKHIDLMNQITT